MSQLPADIIAHCNAHPLCRDCPLGTCTAPLVDADSPKWTEWLESRIAAVRALKEAA